MLCVGAFFWAYAEFILRFVPVVRLTREVNLLPYLLCVVAGNVVGGAVVVAGIYWVVYLRVAAGPEDVDRR